MYSVIFASEEVLSDPMTIVVSPSKDKWNDFGFSIRVDFLITDVDNQAFSVKLSGYFGFLGEEEKEPDVRSLQNLLSKSPNGILLSSQIPRFFMMLPDLQSYRQIVSLLGSERAIKALAAMNDIVAAEEGFSGSSFLAEAKEARVFRHAFLRASEAFFAWTNAGPILRGLQNEKIGRISNTFDIRFQLAGRPNEHKLTFKFDVSQDVLPRRFAVVIGKNGVGKSLALGRIARAALSGEDTLTDGKGSRPSLNRLLAFVPTSIASSVFPSERRRRPQVWYRRFALGYQGASRGKRTTSELILQLARTKERIRDRDRFRLFQTAIATIDDAQNLGLRMNLGDHVRFEELRSGNEGEQLDRYSSLDLRREPVRMIEGRPYPLSSGEHAFLRFAAIASLYIENGTLILLDEPETHLHPNFISQFVSVLDTLLEQTGSAAIIATHSVYFVREAFEDQVIVLRSEKDRSIVAERPTLKTFGADVGSISYFVFGEDEPSRLARKVEDRIASDSSSWSDTFESYKDDLSLELLGDIRARIEPPRPARNRE